MKNRKFLSLIALAGALTLTACNGGDGSSSPSSPSSTPIVSTPSDSTPVSSNSTPSSSTPSSPDSSTTPSIDSSSSSTTPSTDSSSSSSSSSAEEPEIELTSLQLIIGDTELSAGERTQVNVIPNEGVQLDPDAIEFTITSADTGRAHVESFELVAERFGTISVTARVGEVASSPVTVTISPVSTLVNGGFETGDLTGWTIVEGSAFTDGGVLPSDGMFWENRNYQGAGDYIFDGASMEASGTASTMISSDFKIEEAFVAFRMGGGQDREKIHVDLVDSQTDEVLLTWTNDYFKNPEFSLNLIQRIADVSSFIGRVAHFRVVDEDTDGDFGFVTLDDFRVNLTVAGAQALADEALSAASYVADEGGAGAQTPESYVAYLHDRVSYPFAGEAPTVSYEGEYAGEATTSPTDVYSYSALIDSVRSSASDDYTARADLRVTLTAVQGPDGEPVTTGESLALTQVGDYTLTFSVADAFDQMAQREAVAVVHVLTAADDIVNGNFDDGFQGWIASGDAFTGDNLIVDETSTYWNGRHFQSDGRFYSGESVEGATGTLTSSDFRLTEDYVSFLMGAGANADQVHIDLVDASTGEVLARWSNRYFLDPQFSLTMVRYVYDVSAFKGRAVHFQVVDQATSGFGFVTLDDFRVNLTSKDAAQIAAAARDAANYVGDESGNAGVMDAQGYADYYVNTVSFPLAGTAPSVQSGLTATVEASASFDPASLIAQVRAASLDDYTSRSELSVALTSLTFGDKTLTEGLTSLDLSQEGEYHLTFDVTDAFAQTAAVELTLTVTAPAASEA